MLRQQPANEYSDTRCDHADSKSNNVNHRNSPPLACENAFLFFHDWRLLAIGLGVMVRVPDAAANRGYPPLPDRTLESFTRRMTCLGPLGTKFEMI
jgi:hypothetical protein